MDTVAVEVIKVPRDWFDVLSLLAALLIAPLAAFFAARYGVVRGGRLAQENAERALERQARHQEERRRAEDHRRTPAIRWRMAAAMHLLLTDMRRLCDMLESHGPIGGQLKFMEENIGPKLERVQRLQGRLVVLRKQELEAEFGQWLYQVHFWLDAAREADIEVGAFVLTGEPGETIPTPRDRSSYRTKFLEVLNRGNRIIDTIKPPKA